MRIITGFRDLPNDARGGAVAIGNMDGVHAGHRAVIDLARRAAGRLGAPLAVATFEPHPRRYFKPLDPPFLLMSRDTRRAALGAIGVDILYELPFDEDMAARSAERFIGEVLAGGLGVRAVAVGFDFQFGKDRGGDAETLMRAGPAMGFEVSVAQPVSEDAEKISSSRIRQALREGRPEDAAALLGRPWVIDGRVEKGEQIGRTLGFPTANIALGELVRPRFGVYATRSRIEGEATWRPGVANIGRRPTIAGGLEARLEVYLFDFAGDLYGKRLETALIAFQRDDAKYDSLDALKDQIAKDADEARAILGA